jgi:hypothetical protein
MVAQTTKIDVEELKSVWLPRIFELGVDEVVDEVRLALQLLEHALSFATIADVPIMSGELVPSPGPISDIVLRIGTPVGATTTITTIAPVVATVAFNVPIVKDHTPVKTVMVWKQMQVDVRQVGGFLQRIVRLVPVLVLLVVENKPMSTSMATQMVSSFCCANFPKIQVS